jgi:peptidoglycan hydrolase CwlO-like protein
VRAIAKSVEQDVVEARDVTREYVDREAALHNARAEEQQYLLILKRAASVKDVLEVSSKLAEVRAHIDELQTDLRSLHSQGDMSLLTIKRHRNG